MPFVGVFFCSDAAGMSSNHIVYLWDTELVSLTCFRAKYVSKNTAKYLAKMLPLVLKRVLLSTMKEVLYKHGPQGHTDSKAMTTNTT